MEAPKKYKKKPVEIEAIQFLGDDNKFNVVYFLKDSGPFEADFKDDDTIVIRTLEGHITASKGDWIVKGVKGEFWPVRQDIFALTYDEVPDQEVFRIIPTCPVCGGPSLLVERRPDGKAECQDCTWEGPYSWCFKEHT